MRQAVIVSTARTPIGKAYRGAFNATTAPALGAHAIKHAAERAKVDFAEIEDVVMGCALQQGTAFQNVARQAALRAGFPVSVPGMSVDRQCASGMMAIATAAKQVVADNMDVVIGAGVESISTNQTSDMFVRPDPWLMENLPATYMQMIETAEIVAERYDISRAAQDEYSLQSQQRTHAAQQAGKFDDEIVALPSVMKFKNKETGEVSDVEATLEKDEGNRPETTLEGLSGLKLVFPGGQVVKEGKCITAGNASQLSDGASATVVMEAKQAERRGLSPLGIYRGMAVAGTNPDEMGIGPVFAVPKLLEKNGLKMDDIGLWELNEA
ncbi:3-ketoacyl-CoA thiolase @ Acetyl-CoA acetyltransferase, partial [hydrothermal vent metagenome]